MTQWQHDVLNKEVLLLDWFIKSDGNPEDGEERYSWTEELDRFLYVIERGE